MKAVIITPAYSHSDHRLTEAVRESGLPWLELHEHSDLPRARSVLIDGALRYGAERLILVDADSVPTAGTLHALAESDQVTPERALWGMYPLREGDRWSVNPTDAVEADLAIREGRPFSIQTGGLGLCAIHRESLLRLGGTLPVVSEREGLTWRPFCVPFVRDETYYADDGSLCARLRETGTYLWADPRLRCGHAVRTVIRGLGG